MISPSSTTITSGVATLAWVDLIIWIHRTLLAQARNTRGWMSWETQAVTQTSFPPLRRRYPSTRPIHPTPKSVSRTVNNCCSKTHSSIVGNAPPSYQDTTTPSSSQGSTVPFQFSSHPSLVLPSPSPVPTLSRGCRYFSNAHQDSFAHLLPSAPSLSPDSSTAPVTPTLNLYPQPRITTNPSGLDFSFPAVAESPSLPAAHSTSVYGPTWEECKLTSSYTLDLTRVLTTHDIKYCLNFTLQTPSVLIFLLWAWSR